MKLLQVLRLCERTVLVTILIGMVGIYFMGVVTREIGGTFASQFAWVDEAARLLNLFLVFLAMGLALERGKQVHIDVLHRHLPPRVLWGLRKVIDAVGVAFSIYLVWLGLTLVEFVLNTNQTSPTLGLPMGYIYMAPVVGFGLLALRFALSLVGLLDRHPDYSQEPGEAH